MMKIFTFFLIIHLSLISLSCFAQQQIPSISNISSDSLLKDWIDFKNLSFQFQQKHAEDKLFIDKIKEEGSELYSNHSITQQLKSSQKILLNQVQTLQPENQKIKEILIVYKEYIELNYQFEIDFNKQHLDIELVKKLEQKRTLLDSLQADINQSILKYLNKNQPIENIFINDWLAYKLLMERISSENKINMENRNQLSHHSNLEAFIFQLKETSKTNIQSLKNVKTNSPAIQNQINLRIREYQLLSQSFNLDGMTHDKKVELFILGDEIEQQEQQLDQDVVKLIQQHLINL